MKFTNILTLIVPFHPQNEPYYPRICQNCINVIGTQHCRIFGNVDLISGKRHYLSCSIVRQNDTMCGTEGKYYTRYVPFIDN